MKAWATLLTQPDYLVGVRVLHASLRRTGTPHPLVVMVTPEVDATSRQVLLDDGCLVREVPPLRPDSHLEANYANARFAEVWTKLASWSLVEFERLVVLDADMLVVAAMDELFSLELPAGGVAACHACRCNPNRIASYPASWTPANCFYTHCRGVDHTEQPDLVDNYFNGGFLVVDPDQAVFEALLSRLGGLTDLTRYQFAEQDFLNEFFAGRWRPMPYVYNALKTLPHQHPQLWDAAEVKNIHYIIDKPWEGRTEPGSRYHDLHELWWEVAEHDVLAVPTVP
ncbi:glycosyltransferase family 8 protein [Kineococcus rubinsiae]|uniref:glycosyltransferase family 8 protein n=1 Tax=Kineococcus rubinsiae TaxID=2609562 RepID=UPI00142FF78D|nr:glycosyltransferase family 8 protein [Kineococcus rubinsiae]NIZ93606.1 glycosyltransferase family 8 protein [Kineococcus rubinsiae]